MSIVLFIEHVDQKIKKTSKELLVQANVMKKTKGSHVVAVMQNSEAVSKELANYGVEKVYGIEGNYHPETYTNGLQSIWEKENGTLFLASVNALTKDLLPKLAARLDIPMISESIAWKAQGDQFSFQRPMYSGKCNIWVTPKSNAIVTFRPNLFETQGEFATTQPQVETVSAGEPSQDQARCIEHIAPTSEKIDVTQASVVITAGRSIGSAEKFTLLEPLAKVLGAGIGASRAAVDAGFAPHSMQIGQTGKVVNPKLYIALGVSGAIQHLAGMRTSKVIVVVNTDKDAPIFQHADYGIVGDMFEVIPQLTKAFEKLLNQ